MAKIDNILLKAKFRGSMLGSLIGDCLGGPFEGDTYSPGFRLVLQTNLDKLEGPLFKAPKRPYSDDTAMTKSVAKCLIEKPAVDYKYMARLFVDEYYNQPRRGYGKNIVSVFEKLRSAKCQDIYKPAMEQFGGSGSYGNGGAMRVAPIPLFFHNNYNGMTDATVKSTEITHTNKLGINGALLQCIAIYQSLHLNPDDELDIHKFTDDLIEKMKRFEGERKTVKKGEDDPAPYQTQLHMLKQLLLCDSATDPIKVEEIIGALGNEVNALYSVPTAIYCFLKAHSGFPEVESNNVFRRAIQYAITLGGDTDTIASMAGAITGAYFGEEVINKNFLSHCEYTKETIEAADNLYNASNGLDSVAINNV